ncbi:MAG: glycosyltransferase [Alphaproteobacteria bacterium]
MAEPVWIGLAVAGAALWGGILALPWRPWSTREALDAERSGDDLGDVTVLIPARDEADVIGQTLRALGAQGHGLNVILVDDQSTDGTALAARAAGLTNLSVIEGAPLAPGWSGKLWALEQARRELATPFALLLDADIELAPGLIATLRAKMKDEDLGLISLMARLRMANFWEALLMPAFVYFFKLLYPFHIANSKSSIVAAAAGGCILIETRALDAIGGFGAVRDAIIDDCALARAVKKKGYRTWIGLSRSVVSLRRYTKLGTIWNMVARSAYTQLRYSPLLLFICTLALAAGCWLPPVGLAVFPGPLAKIVSAGAIAAMVLGYLPTLRYYGLSPAFALAMPVIGSLFLAMTWTSALRYWRGERSQWKGRSYRREGAPNG